MKMSLNDMKNVMEWYGKYAVWCDKYIQKGYPKKLTDKGIMKKTWKEIYYKQSIQHVFTAMQWVRNM